MARNATAIPAAVVKNDLLLIPCFRANSVPISFRRDSTSRCCLFWRWGKNSSLETIWVGMGPAKEDVSAGFRACNSSGLKKLLILKVPSKPPDEGRLLVNVKHKCSGKIRLLAQYQ